MEHEYHMQRHEQIVQHKVAMGRACARSLDALGKVLSPEQIIFLYDKWEKGGFLNV